MPRSIRQFYPGYPHHLVIRGNNGEDMFRKDMDRLFFVECMERASADFELTVHAYVLMTNHIHLLATGAHSGSASGFFRSLGARYVPVFNDANRRTGGLWVRRYWSSIVQSDDYLLNCMRYIEMNPVRARMVDSPGSYYWSSHIVHALGVQHPLVKPHPTFLALGDSPEGRRHAYRHFFDREKDTRAMDERFRQSVRRGWPVGDEAFVRWADSLQIAA